jgi:hypothetical protein
MESLCGTKDGVEFWQKSLSIDTTSRRRRGRKNNIKLHLQQIRQAVPTLVADISPRTFEFDPRLVYVGLEVGKLPMRQTYLEEFSFLPSVLFHQFCKLINPFIADAI